MVKIMVPNPIFLLDDLGGRPTPIFGLTPIFKRLISVEGDGFGSLTCRL